MDIDLRYEMRKVSDICVIERGKKAKIYPRNTSLITLSGSNDIVLRLDEAGEVESRYACIYSDEYDNAYLNWMIADAYPAFYHRYNCGINFQFKDLSYFEIPIHTNMDTQKYCASSIEIVNSAIKQQKKIIEETRVLRKTMLEKLFI